MRIGISIGLSAHFDQLHDSLRLTHEIPRYLRLTIILFQRQTCRVPLLIQTQTESVADSKTPVFDLNPEFSLLSPRIRDLRNFLRNDLEREKLTNPKKSHRFSPFIPFLAYLSFPLFSFDLNSGFLRNSLPSLLPLLSLSPSFPSLPFPPCFPCLFPFPPARILEGGINALPLKISS